MTITLVDIAIKVTLFFVVLFGAIFITKIFVKWSESKKRDSK